MRQLTETNGQLHEAYQVNLQVLGLMDSQKMLLGDIPIDFENWQDNVAQTRTNLSHFINYFSQSNIPHKVANAMDVGNPSNLERLETLFGSFRQFKQNVKALSIANQQIEESIKQTYEDYGYIACPHTATAFSVRQHLNQQPWIILATADPCKFKPLIEPIINHPIPMAPQLQRLLARPQKTQHVKANLDEIGRLIDAKASLFS